MCCRSTGPDDGQRAAHGVLLLRSNHSTGCGITCHHSVHICGSAFPPTLLDPGVPLLTVRITCPLSLLRQECQEVLLDAGIAPNSNCASRAIGYRQAGEALQRWHADPESLTEQSVVRAGPGRWGFCVACMLGSFRTTCTCWR